MHQNIRARRVSLLAAVIALALCVCQAVSGGGTYDPGASDTEIRIGNTNPYSGPASSYGTIGRSITAYFNKVNEEGGVNGRRINFISLFQTLGTPTNTAIWKYVNEQKIPHVFIATGATKWGDPVGHPWTMGWQPTYQTEGRIYANYILQHVREPKIGILYQNDDYGKDYVKGLKDGLGEVTARKLIVSEQTYEVTDPSIESQIINLKNSGANVFFNVTIPKFAIQAIRKAHDLEWQPPADPQPGLRLGRCRSPPGRDRRVHGACDRALHKGTHGSRVGE